VKAEGGRKRECRVFGVDTTMVVLSFVHPLRYQLHSSI